MKKLYTLLLGAIFALPTMAQEEDVTHLITNPGFDEDLTFTVDGFTKEIVDNSGSLSARSHKWIAADGSIYARTKTSAEGNTNWKRNDITDGLCVNGFLGQIKGWSLETGSNGEWTYFGVLPYSIGPGSTTIGVADDNNNSWLTVAGKPEEANTPDNLGTMYLRAGWTNYAVYTQTVKLPCAQYRLEYWINNMNFAGTNPDGLENRCKITCRKDVFPDTEGVNADGWEKHTIEFTPTAEFTIHMGFKSANRGSGTNPILLIDGLKLYKIGEADEQELVSSDLSEQIDSLTFLQENLFIAYDGIAEEISDSISNYYDILDSGDLEAMKAAYNTIRAYITKLNEDVTPKIDAFDAVMDEAAALLEMEEPYDGIDEFTEAYKEFDEYRSNGFPSLDDETAPTDYIEIATENLKAAIKAYYQSQPASPENPADYTYLVDNPTFAAQGKWYIGQDGGDQTIKTDKTDNDGNVINCWNAWRNNLEIGNSVSISQDLEGLPNGKYTVTADMNTQDGCITDQHVFATSSIDSAVSPVMTVTGWDPCVWETLTTATVIVVDGKLTIGAIGNGDGDTPDNHGGTDTDKRRGWFNMTNVKLNYLGAASEEEIAAAIAAKYAAAEEIAAKVQYGKDKEDVTAAVAAAKEAQDMEALNEAVKLAEASIADYEAVTNGTYKTLADSTFASANVNAVKNVVVDLTKNYINSAAATYTYTSVYTATLQYVLNTLAPAIAKAEAAVEECQAQSAKDVINGTIKSVVNNVKSLKEIVPATSSSFLPEQIALLNKALEIAAKADVEVADGADVTAYISNPTCDNVNGWTVVKPVGDGNGVKTSQQFDGNTAGGYIDTYNANAGTLRASMYQVLDVPNGKYTVSNIMRTSGTGAYLFASDAEPVKTDAGTALDPASTVALSLAVAKATNNAKYGIEPVDADGNPTGEEETVYTDTYGEIYCASADRVMAAMGISAVPGTSIYDLAIDANNGDETCPEDVDPLDWAIIGANGGKGRGWFNNSVEIEVKNHVLVIGVTCDYVFANKTEEEAFSGTWFSADNFKLTLDKVGDNAGWDPTTGIESVATVAKSVKAIFNVNGARIASLQKGINIVKMTDGSVQKVLVK